MSKFKKLICLLITTLLLFALSITVSASNETSDSNIKIEVATDKSEYNATSVAEITATITNVGDKDIDNVTAQVVFGDLAPAGKKNSQIKKTVDTLEAGESFSFTYKATLDKDEHDLNIFQKIILFFVRLFNGGYDTNNNNIEFVTENVTEINFGKFTAENVIQVGYENAETDLTDEDFDNMEIVENALSEIEKSENWSELSIDKRKEIIENAINDFANDGYIVKDSIEYYEDDNMFYFQYVCGWDYYFSLSFCEDHSLCTENVDGAIFDENMFLNHSNTVSTYALNRTIKSPSYWGRQIIIYGWDSVDYFAKNHEENQKLLNEYKKFAAACDSVGIQSTVYTNSSVELYRNILKGNDLIVIAEHGVEYKNKNKVGFVIKEKSTRNNKKNYANDKSENRIEIINGHYVITPEFISHYYSNNSLDEAIIYIGSCQGFGRNGVVNCSFSYAFDNNCGASCTLGFCETVRTQYQWQIMIEFIPALIYGETTKNALDIATGKYGAKGPNGEFPILTNYYSKLSNTGTVTGTILEQSTETPIKNVIVTATKDKLIKTTLTDENGVFRFELPIGNWEITFSSDTHTYNEYVAVKIEKDVDRVLQNPIYMVEIKTDTIKSTVTGTVTDSKTGNPISNVSVEVIDNESGSLDPIATATTDINGKYEIKVPYGSYSLSFKHSDYEDYGTSLTVNYEAYEKNVSLLPKDNSGDDNTGDSGDTEERTVIDLGECGAEGSNVTWVLYEDGELVISGNGAMEDYSSSSNSPWYANKSSITKVTINEGITGIGIYAFYGCRKLTNVVIPNSVSSIGNTAFFECESLENIELPDSITSIGSYAFAYCYNLKSVIISKNVTNIGEYAFNFCHNLSTVTVDNNNKYYSSDEYGVLFNKNKTNLIYYPGGNKSIKYSIPDSTTIVGYDSINNDYLESITIGSSIEGINAVYFRRCNNLTNIKVSEKNKYYSNDEYGVLFNKDKTELVFYPNANERTVYTVPFGVVKIGNNAFYNSNNLKNIVLPNSITEIGREAFRFCQAIEKIEIPNSVTVIESWAFESCTGLTSIVIPNSITRISSYTFQDCSSLTTITIPDSITTIEALAFADTKISNIYYSGTQEQWNAITGGGKPSNATIHYNA